jgi:hypothetical protein
MLRPQTNELSPREWAQQEHDKEMYRLQAETQLKLKSMELEIAKLEAKWSSWLKIPVKIILLPVYCLMAIGFIITSFREDKEPGQNFWDFLKK